MSSTVLSLAAAVSEAEQAGRVAGFMIVFSGGLLGVIKCISIMRRPTTSTLCVLSLLLLLVAWVFSSLFSVIKDYAEEPGAAFAVLMPIIFSLLVLGAGVLAIVGLCLYDKQRFNQGRAQAIWSLVLVSLIITCGVMMVVVRTALRDRQMTQFPAGASSDGAIEFKDYNFSVKPGAGWNRMNAAAINPQAVLCMRKIRPDVYFMVVAEKAGMEIEPKLMVEMVKANLASIATVSDQVEEQVTIDGVPFHHITTRCKMGGLGQAIEYDHWVASHSGYAWQLVFWTGGQRSTLTECAAPIARSFRLMDPNASLLGSSRVENVERPQYGYRTLPSEDVWSKWQGGDLNPLIDYKAQRLNEAMMVLPLRFDEEPPPIAVLADALVHVVVEADVHMDEFRVKPWDPGHGGEGREMTLERSVGGSPISYVARIARTKDSAHLVIGWAALPAGRTETVRRALDSVKLEAAQGAPPELDAKRKQQLGLLYNDFGLACMAKGSHRDSARWFEKGFALAGDPVLLGNLAHAMELAGAARKGVELVSPLIGRHPENVYAGYHYARLLALAGDVAGAEKEFLRVLDRGFQKQDDLLAWLQLLNKDGHADAAVRCADEWVKRMPTPQARLWQAQTYSVAGNLDGAVAILESLRKESPDDLAVAYELGECYNEHDQGIKAAEIAEAILKEAQDSPRAWMILGWSQMNRKWYRDAKQSFERAQKGWPDEESVKEAIRIASAALGQGDNASARQPLEPVAVPADLEKRIAAIALPEGAGKDQPAIWEKRVTGHYSAKGKPSKRTSCYRIRILTNEGAKEFSSVTQKFDPLDERIFLNHLEVRDEQGKVLYKAGLGDLYVRDESDGTASDQKVLHVQVAGVRPGVVVDWQVTVEGRSAEEQPEYRRGLFAAHLDTAVEAFFVTGDLAAIKAVVRNGNGLEAVKGDGYRGWIQGYRKAHVFEPLAVSFDHCAPIVTLGPEGKSWREVSDKYLDDIKDCLALTPEVRELAQRVAAGKTTERERIAAVMAHVQREVAYQAIEFGVRGLRPNAPVRTLELRYGDCKDMAVLVKQMLAALDIKANLALANTIWDVVPEQVSLDQFNHMVVQVPSLGENWLLDPTDKVLDQPKLRADGFWSNRVLVLEPGASRLIDLPGHADAGSSCLTSNRSVTLAEGGWDVEEVLDFDGYIASWVRQSFIGLGEEDQQREAQRMLAGDGSVKVKRFRFDNLADPQRPARITLAYHVHSAVTEIEGHSTMRVPAIWEKDYLATQFIQNRWSAFRVNYPLRIISRVKASLPKTAVPTGLDAWGKGKASEFCDWKLSASAAGPVVSLDVDFTAKVGVFGPDRYEAFHNAWEESRRAWDKPLVWKEAAPPGGP